jgi:hypothetical protein
MTKKTMRSRTGDLVGGGSNTPLPNTFIEKTSLDKRVLIDWLSVSFDCFDVSKIRGNIFRIDGSKIFNEFISLLGFQNDAKYLQQVRPVRGYYNAYGIGENIKLLYGGEHTKNKHDRYTMNLLMSGEACREFEINLKRKWHPLLEFIFKYNGQVKRLDIAIDDFDANEIDIYDIENEFVRTRNYTSPMRSCDVRYNFKKTSDGDISTGFSMTFGSAGSSQFQIYDKKLERMVKNVPDLETEKWYRYEMRFVNEKAQSVAQRYLSSVNSGDDASFMTYASELLYASLDLKNPTSDINRSRWPTDPRWISFLNEVKKIKFDAYENVNTTIMRRKLWHTHSMTKVQAEFFLSNVDGSFNKFMDNQVLIGLEKIDDISIARVNNYRESLGMEKITMLDVMQIRMAMQKDVDDDFNG